MGFSSNQQTESDRLIEEQYKQNKMEMEEKRKKLYQERLDIIKSQGTQKWYPDKPNNNMMGGRGGL